MGRYTPSLAVALADAAGVVPGMRVLDVGCGPGADVREGVAEQLPWDGDSFDAALSSLVIAFMNDASGAALDPDAWGEHSLAGTGRGQIAQLLRDAGLRDVTDHTSSGHADYAGFDDFWQPFTIAVGPAGPARGLPAERCPRSHRRR
jgi:hypothetical protein